MAQGEIIKANLKTEKQENVKSNTKRVCAYCRVSTDSEEQQTSYNSQIKHYSAQIKSNPNWEFVGIYADEGISGTQVKNRTEFQRMLNDALDGKIDIIIAKSISRFARNTIDTLKYARLLRDHKIDIYFEKENIHTLDLDSEMFLTLYSAFAQAESESTSMNVKLGLKAIMKRGDPVGNPNCYGYEWDKDTKTFKINEEQAEVVRKIFNWYVLGIGSYTIAKKLNNEKILTQWGNKWCPSSVRRILTNEKYIGDLLGQKTYVSNPLTHKHIINYGEKEKYYVKDHHKPIITRDVWNKSQEIYSKRGNKLQPDGKQHNGKFSLRYPYSSKIECGMCGANFTRRMNEKRKDGTRKVYWACTRRITYIENCSNSLFITEEILNDIFVKIYNTIIEKKHKTKEKLFNAIKETLTKDDSKSKIDKLLNEKETLEKRLSNLIDIKLDDYENKEAYINKEKEINAELKKIKEQITEYELINSTNKNISKRLSQIEKILDEPKTIKEFDREIFDSLVEKIIIGEKDESNNINPNTIRFILKIGTKYKYEINENKNVSLRPDNVG